MTCRLALRPSGCRLMSYTQPPPRDIDAAFTKLQLNPHPLLTSAEALFTSRRAQLIVLAARHAIPAVYHLREFAEIGGLMSYGPDFANVYRQLGIYTGRVLKGRKAQRPASSTAHQI